MEDAVRPSKEATELMRVKSLSSWSQSSQLIGHPGLPLDCVRPRQMLGRVPAYLARGIFKSEKTTPSLHRIQLMDRSSTLFVNGRSTWQTSGEDCLLEPRVLQHQLLLGVQRSTPCVFADDSRFGYWPGVQGTGDHPEEGNYLAILVFAWAYILSATWLEMQLPNLQDNRMRYLDCRAPVLDNSDEKRQDGIEIGLDYTPDDAARWWAAILSPGEGWQATISTNGQVYRSPWSVCINAAQRFVLRKKSGWDQVNDDPP